MESITNSVADLALLFVLCHVGGVLWCIATVGIADAVRLIRRAGEGRGVE